MARIFNLMQNKLTTNIIPDKILANTVKDIQETLNAKRLEFQLLFSDPH